MLHSETLRGEYKPLKDLPEGFLTKNGGGVGAGHYDQKSGEMWYFTSKHVAKGHGSARMTEIHGTKKKGPLHPIDAEEFRTIIEGNDFLNENYLVASPGFYAFPDAP